MRRKWGLLLAAIFWGSCNCELAQAQTPNLRPADRAKVTNTIRSLLLDPSPQIEKWSGSDGSSGEVTMRAVISSSEGRTCADLANCPSPCRGYRFTFVGERSDGWIVNEERAGRYCLNGRQWTLAGAERVNNSQKLQKSAALIANEDRVKRNAEEEEQRRLAARRAQEEEGRRQAARRADAERRAQADITAASEQQALRKASIEAIQSGLEALQYYSGGIDGVMGQGTRAAMRAFLDDLAEGVLAANPTNSDLASLADRISAAVSQNARQPRCVEIVSPFMACAIIAGL